MFLSQTRSNQKIWNIHNKLFSLRPIYMQSLRRKLKTHFFWCSWGGPRLFPKYIVKMLYLSSKKLSARPLFRIFIAHYDLYDAHSSDSKAIDQLVVLPRKTMLESIHLSKEQDSTTCQFILWEFFQLKCFVWKILFDLTKKNSLLKRCFFIIFSYAINKQLFLSENDHSQIVID